MRPLLALGILALSFLPLSSQASWDIYQSYVIIDSGSGNQYLAGGRNADGASAFDGTHLGDVLASDALTLNGGELKTWKNGSSNVCGGNLQYRVYLSGDAAGGFSPVNLGYDSELGGGNQKWDETGAAIDLISGLSPGDYVLEVYWDASGSENDPGGCGETQYDSDSGNNFTATFSILGASACGTSVNFDGYDYETVQIGDQCWFAENLRTTVYADGTAIPEVTDNATWVGLSSGARSDYNNMAAYVDLYGRLYNWWAVGNASGLCPSGWHVPTDGEWTHLENYISAQGFSGTEGTALKSTSFSQYSSGNGTDDFGFTALGGGIRSVSSHSNYCGCFSNAGSFGYWWSSSLDGCGGLCGEAWQRRVGYDIEFVGRWHSNRSTGLSVRCLSDANYNDNQGCTDPEYIEYDAYATTDDGSCATPVVEGCTDSDYTEYNASANTDDGSCATPVVEGCTDSDYTEYNASANTDDDSCATPVVEGCTDSDYTEYNASANTDDGSCATLVVEGCMDPSACNYDDAATIDDASCESLSCAGCTNPAYTEYDASATIDNGSCATLADLCAGALVLGSIEVDLSTTTLTSEDGSATLTVTTGTPTSLTLTGLNGASDYSIDQPGAIDGIAAGYYQVTAIDADGCNSDTLKLVMTYALCCDCGVSDIDTDGICDDEDNCTDRTAPNYDDPNNADCNVSGCTDSNYAEYNPNANSDDGSCVTLTATCVSPEMDGHSYNVVEIGDQCWFAENLRTAVYANGDAVPTGLNDGEWISTNSGATAVYGEGVSGCNTFSPGLDACDEVQALAEYGRLYNWYAVNDSRGLCPNGWHVPTDGEWTDLEDHVASQGFGGPTVEALKSTSGWNNGGNGTDNVGFSAIPGGYREYDDYFGPPTGGSFNTAGNSGYWWTSSQSAQKAWNRVFYFWYDQVVKNSHDLHNGFSVRCLRDDD